MGTARGHVVHDIRRAAYGLGVDHMLANDRVLASALAAAQAALPDVLTPLRPRPFGVGSRPVELPASLETPLEQDFRTAVVSDDVLARLVTAGAILYSDGSGGQWQFERLLPGLLQATRDRMQAQDERLTPESWLAEIRTSIDELRRLAKGETICCPVVVGITGLPLPDDFVADLGELGSLRPARVHEIARHAETRDPTAVLQRFDRLGVEFLPGMTAHSIARWIGPSDPHVKAANCVCSGAVLAMPTPIPRWFAPTVATVATTRPIAGNTGGARFETGPNRSDAAAQAPAAFLDSLETWIRRVVVGFDASLDVADSRLRSALRRAGDTDGLIDAVIAWENLVGASRGTFRITGALAILLEQDPARRHRRERELAKIYNARSRIVHGEAHDATKVREACYEAITTAAEAFRRLYRDLPHLLPDPERGTRLLLGDIAPR